MTPKAFGARIDANHPEIRDALRKAGYIVCDTFRAGFGVPDMFVLSKSKHWIGFEIKVPGEKLTKKEAELFDQVCPGPLYTVTTAEQALVLLDEYDRKP